MRYLHTIFGDIYYMKAFSYAITHSCNSLKKVIKTFINYNAAIVVTKIAALKVEIWPAQSKIIKRVIFLRSIRLLTKFRSNFGSGQIWSIPVPVPVKFQFRSIYETNCDLVTRKNYKLW